MNLLRIVRVMTTFMFHNGDNNIETINNDPKKIKKRRTRELLLELSLRLNSRGIINNRDDLIIR